MAAVILTNGLLPFLLDRVKHETWLLTGLSLLEPKAQFFSYLCYLLLTLFRELGQMILNLCARRRIIGIMIADLFLFQALSCL